MDRIHHRDQSRRLKHRIDRWPRSGDSNEPRARARHGEARRRDHRAPEPKPSTPAATGGSRHDFRAKRSAPDPWPCRWAASRPAETAAPLQQTQAKCSGRRQWHRHRPRRASPTPRSRRLRSRPSKARRAAASSRARRQSLDRRSADRSDRAGGQSPGSRERDDRRVGAAFALAPSSWPAQREAPRPAGRGSTVVEQDPQRRPQRSPAPAFHRHRGRRGHDPQLRTTIDCGPVPVAVGSTVRVHGLFEWTPKGGVVHWTHHDPSGKTPGGWIRCGGKTYS